MANPIMTAQIVSEAEVDRSLWKIFILGILFIGGSWLAVQAFNQFLLGLTPALFLYALLGTVFFLAMLLLNVFFIKSYPKIILLVLLAAAVPLAVFYPRLEPVLLGGLGVYFLFLLNASRRGYRSLENSMKVRFFLTAGAILPKAVTGLLLLFAVLFFSRYFDLAAGNFNERFNRAFISQLVTVGEPAVRFFLPGFSASQPTDETLKLFVRGQINSLVPDYERYLPEVRERIFNETFVTFKRNLETAVGPVDGQAPLAENLYRLLAERYLNELDGDGRFYFAVGFTVVLFLVAKGVISIFHWLIGFLAFLVFKMLLITNFGYISLENRSREFVALT